MEVELKEIRLSLNRLKEQLNELYETQRMLEQMGKTMDDALDPKFNNARTKNRNKPQAV
jgi:hypothetical protein